MHLTHAFTGHVNLTTATFHSTISSNKLVLVGFSSLSCHKCIAEEIEYEAISIKLARRKQVLFGRVNVDQAKGIASQYGVTRLPALILFYETRAYTYKGAHGYTSVIAWIDKILTPSPVKQLPTVEEVEDFINVDRKGKLNIQSVNIIGFFSSHESMEEDEYEDYVEVCKELQFSEETYCSIVTSKKIAQHFIQSKEVDRTPSLLLISESGKHSINMNELDNDMGIRQWVERKSIPLAGKVSGENFLQYEKTGLPMLLMFLDLTDELATSTPGLVVGGRSGGILNEVLVQELRLVAKEHVGRILFMYLDGNAFPDQMKSLGLLGGVERLPSIAFNTRDKSQLVFPESLPINFDTLNKFAAGVLYGKLRSKKDIKEFQDKALVEVTTNQRNLAVRKKKKEAPPVERGISEQFDAAYDKLEYVSVVTASNFDSMAMEEGMDVLLMLHSEGCEPCAHFIVYYKKVAERFKDLNISTLRIARMDVTRSTPPADLHLLGVGTLPTVVMLPAYAKREPWSFFSGIGKPQELMKWVHNQAAIPFELPNLPHLTPEQRVLYKEQITEREEYMDSKAKEDAEAMQREDDKRNKFIDDALKTAEYVHEEL